MNRRNFLKTGAAGILIASAPAIVREGLVMSVKVDRPFLDAAYSAQGYNVGIELLREGGAK